MRDTYYEDHCHIRIILGLVCWMEETGSGVVACLKYLGRVLCAKIGRALAFEAGLSPGYFSKWR